MDMDTQSRLSFYRELEPIGDKNNVCIVKHIETGQIYIRKILKRYDKAIYDTIQRESIPYVPQIYESIESDGRLYVIEEYIQGITLDTYMDRYGLLSRQQACWIIECLCQILTRFHGLTPPVIHRDIKPANVMLKGTFIDRASIQGVYLIDFDTARRFDISAGRDTLLMGTRGFAAPEQYGFSQSDERTDVYALGVMLNYMLTGDIVSNGIYKFDVRIESVIRRSTDMSPERRFQNVSQLAAELANAGTDGATCVANTYQSSSEPEEKADSERLIQNKNWRRYLPPGFRQRKPANVILGSLCYIMLLWFCFTVTVSDGKTGSQITGNELTAYRVVYFVMFFGLALIWGNYMNIWSYIPLLNRSKRWIKALGVVLYSIFWLLLVFIWFVLLEHFVKI